MKKALLLTGLCTTALLLLAAQATSRAAYETAPYRIVLKNDSMEIRDYPALTTASTMAAVGDSAGRDGRFKKLFGYISGKNATETKIKMTTPVFMDEAKGQSKMSFVVPAKVAVGGAPAAAVADITVGTRPAARYAMLRFNGRQSTANEQKALAGLRKRMEAMKLPASGSAVFAYYDPPWTPGPWRRNEVMLSTTGP